MLKIYEVVGTDKLVAYDQENHRAYELKELEILDPVKREAEAEKKIKKIIKKYRNKIQPADKPAPAKKRWSKDYDCCVECGTTEKPCVGQGKCKKCYNAEFRNKKIKSSGLNVYECLDCTRQFTSATLETLTGACGRCGGDVIQK